MFYSHDGIYDNITDKESHNLFTDQLPNWIIHFTSGNTIRWLLLAMSDWLHFKPKYDYNYLITFHGWNLGWTLFLVWTVFHIPSHSSLQQSRLHRRNSHSHQNVALQKTRKTIQHLVVLSVQSTSSVIILLELPSHWWWYKTIQRLVIIIIMYKLFVW